jgi:hypothetical protein
VDIFISTGGSLLGAGAEIPEAFSCRVTTRDSGTGVRAVNMTSPEAVRHERRPVEPPAGEYEQFVRSRTPALLRSAYLLTDVYLIGGAR